MKLSDATQLDVSEARYIFETTILEDGEGPRWKFNYDNWHQDPRPDILLLGAYRHPATNNNLVGGINLHYINQDQRDRLARSLPQIMQAKNLRQRYWVGRQLLPDIFNNYYRTYNSRFIRGVNKDVLYPKYGYMKTAQNWLKKKLAALTKSKKQRQQDIQPKYPDDLKSMQDRLDQAVNNLAQQPSDEPEDSPEMRAASQAFQDYQRQQTLQDIEQNENEPMDIAQQDIDQAQVTPGVQPAERYATQEPEQPKIDPEQLAKQAEQQQIDRRKQDIEAIIARNKQANAQLKDFNPNIDIEPQPQPQPQPQQQPPEQPEQQERVTPDQNEPTQKDQSQIDQSEEDQEQEEINIQPKEESIYYYSPKLKRYIFETSPIY